MRRAFTLLELIVVIIIIGILATLGMEQYYRMLERARGVEARQILSAIRSKATGTYTQNTGNCTECNNDNVGIGTGDVPGPTEVDCNSAYYFWYNITVQDANGFTAVGTRCLSNGKEPQGRSPAGTLTLITNFANGSDEWVTTGSY